MARENEESYRKISYIDGNTVRKVKPQRQNEKERQQRHSGAQVRINKTQQSGMNLSMTILVAAALVITLIVCIEYLELRSENTKHLKNISSLQTQLSDLKDENDTSYNRIISSIDLDEIRKKAINQYGMTYPKQEQIITYSTDEDDYLYQYKDVPCN